MALCYVGWVEDTGPPMIHPWSIEARPTRPDHYCKDCLNWTSPSACTRNTSPQDQHRHPILATAMVGRGSSYKEPKRRWMAFGATGGTHTLKPKAKATSQARAVILHLVVVSYGGRGKLLSPETPLQPVKLAVTGRKSCCWPVIGHP